MMENVLGYLFFELSVNDLMVNKNPICHSRVYGWLGEHIQP